MCRRKVDDLTPAYGTRANSVSLHIYCGLVLIGHIPRRSLPVNDNVDTEKRVLAVDRERQVVLFGA